MVDATPEASGAEISRLCGMTPQSGQAMLVELAKHGWIQRQPSKASERILVAELTASGHEVLRQAKAMAEALDKKLWEGNGERELAEMDAILGRAVERLGRT
jgi:DNA-binding MarR family transcriptional regulator